MLKDRRFIVTLKNRAMSRILLLCVKIKNKNNAFAIRWSSGEKRALMVGWLSLDQDLIGL